MTKSNLIFCRILAVFMVLASAFSVNVVANAQVKNDDMISPQCDYRLKTTVTAGDESVVVYAYPS